MRHERDVVHVDDDPAITRLVGQALSQRGFRVTPFHNPCDYLAQLPGRRERVVLLDIDMPEMDGLEVLRRVKAHDGAIQVIIVTGIVTMSTVLESLRSGAEACFFKPLASMDPLVDALDGSFRKLERWWDALEEISCRRKQEAAASDDEVAEFPAVSGCCLGACQK
jgi:DNA-binding NtrC family response regulator